MDTSALALSTRSLRASTASWMALRVSLGPARRPRRVLLVPVRERAGQCEGKCPPVRTI
jgi:hypothetical protein